MMPYQTERLLNFCVGARSSTGHNKAQLGHLLLVTTQEVASRMLDANRRCQQGPRFRFSAAIWTRSRDIIESQGKEVPISRAKTIPPPKMRMGQQELEPHPDPNVSGKTV